MNSKECFEGSFSGCLAVTSRWGAVRNQNWLKLGWNLGRLQPTPCNRSTPKNSTGLDPDWTTGQKSRGQWFWSWTGIPLVLVGNKNFSNFSNFLLQGLQTISTALAAASAYIVPTSVRNRRPLEFYNASDSDQLFHLSQGCQLSSQSSLLYRPSIPNYP